MASCGGSSGFRGQEGGREKIQKRLREMLMYLTLQGNLNKQPSSDGAQAERGQNQLYCEVQPQVPATTVLGD